MEDKLTINKFLYNFDYLQIEWLSKMKGVSIDDTINFWMSKIVPEDLALTVNWSGKPSTTSQKKDLKIGFQKSNFYKVFIREYTSKYSYTIYKEYIHLYSILNFLFLFFSCTQKF